MIPIDTRGTELFRTIVGSTLWGNARPDSDIDEFVCYALPIRDVLIGEVGRSFQKTGLIDPSDNKEHDLSIHEAGVVAHQLLKGNPNFLIGLYSTMPTYEARSLYSTKSHLDMLKEAMKDNVSKQCYNAFKGYGVGHYLKYIESGKDASPRRCNIGVRFFNFGISLLLTGKPDFTPVSDSTPERVFDRFDALQRAYNISPLPEKPENPELVYDWLTNVRMEEL